MNLMLAQENLRLSYKFLSWRRLQYFLAHIRREQNMDSILASAVDISRKSNLGKLASNWISMPQRYDFKAQILQK